MADRLCQRWVITGRVQGVGYRAWMVGEAITRGLDGWVRNLASGSVEAVILGDSERLARLHEVCLQGPPGACVEAIAHSPAEPGSVISGAGFRQVRNGA